MQFQPYLTFDGQAAEAMSTYARILGGDLTALMRYADLPAEMLQEMAGDPACGGALTSPLSEEQGQRVLHAALSLDGAMLMASDTMPGMPYQGQQNVGVTLSFPSVDRARAVFDALSDGGQVEMPWGETFWSEAFGSVRDRFGTQWLVNGGKDKMG